MLHREASPPPIPEGGGQIGLYGDAGRCCSGLGGSCGSQVKLRDTSVRIARAYHADHHLSYTVVFRLA